MSYGFNTPYAVPVPAPAPAPAIPPMATDLVYEIPVSPNPSPPNSRAPSRRRGTTGAPTDHYISYGDESPRGDKRYYSSHLNVGGGLHRSSSVGGGGYRRGEIEVHRSSGDRPRSTYYGRGRHNSGDEEYYNRGRQGHVYYGGGGYPESNYSSSSRGSREPSRGPPAHRRHRSPSCHSCDDYDRPTHHPHSPHMAPYPPANHWPVATIPPAHPPHPPHPSHPQQALMGPAPAPLPHPNQGALALFNPVLEDPAKQELAKKIEMLQKELESSKLEAEKIKQAKEKEEAKKKRAEELAEEVKAEIERQKREAAEEAKRVAKEKQIIEERARLLYLEKVRKEEKEKAEADAKAAAEAKAKEAQEKMVAEVAAKAAEAERQRMDLTKPTYTKFSKTHLCKEALDEKSIMYTEQEDSFLVHRWVPREEQQELWARTKVIRAFQADYAKKFKEAADKAPIINGPNGPFKIVKVGNSPAVQVPVVMVTKKTKR